MGIFLETDFMFSIERNTGEGTVLWFASYDQNHIIYTRIGFLQQAGFINKQKLFRFSSALASLAVKRWALWWNREPLWYKKPQSSSTRMASTTDIAAWKIDWWGASGNAQPARQRESITMLQANPIHILWSRVLDDMFLTLNHVRITLILLQGNTYRKEGIQSIPRCMTDSSCRVHWTSGRGKTVQTRLQPRASCHSQFHTCRHNQ